MDAHCAGDRIECRDATCQCQSGFDMNPETKMCQEIVKLGQQCFVGQTCVDATGSGLYTTCTSGKCQCGPSDLYVEVKGICYPSKNLGSSDCETNEECQAVITGGVVCDQSSTKCKCDTGYGSDNVKFQCWEVDFQFGDECKANWQCQSGNCEQFVNKCGCKPTDQECLAAEVTSTTPKDNSGSTVAFSLWMILLLLSLCLVRM